MSSPDYLRHHRSVENTLEHLNHLHSMPSLSFLLSNGGVRPIQQPPKGQSIVIGRASKAHVDHSITFQCPVMSKNHAELTWDHQQVYLKDTGSTHGTWLKMENGLQKLEPHQAIKLEHGMVIRFGKVIGTGPTTERERHYPVEVTVRLVRSGTYGLTPQMLASEAEEEDEEDDPPIGSHRELALRRRYLSHHHPIDGASGENGEERDDEDEEVDDEEEFEEAEKERARQESRITAFELDENEESSFAVAHNCESDEKPVIESDAASGDHSGFSDQDSAFFPASIESRGEAVCSCEGSEAEGSEAELGSKQDKAELSLEPDLQEPDTVASNSESKGDDESNPDEAKLNAILSQTRSTTSTNSTSTSADSEPDRSKISTGIQTELAVPVSAVKARKELLRCPSHEAQLACCRHSKRAREDDDAEDDNDQEEIPSVAKKSRMTCLLPSMKSVAIFALGGVATVAGILACESA